RWHSILRRFLESVGQRDQSRLAERASRKSHAEWRWIHDGADRRNETTWHHKARITWLFGCGRTAVLRKDNDMEVVLRDLNAIGTIENSIKSGSGERQVRGAI